MASLTTYYNVKSGIINPDGLKKSECVNNPVLSGCVKRIAY